jgi:hypothetical protein
MVGIYKPTLAPRRFKGVTPLTQHINDLKL